MKVLVIDSNYPINTRNSKICDFLRKEKKVKVIISAWLRQGVLAKDKIVENEYIFEYPSKLGDRWSKVVKLFAYFKHLKEVNRIEQPDVLVCSHYDMLFLGYILKKKEQVLVYENLDIPTHSNKTILKTLQVVEKFCLKRTDFMALASRFYAELYADFKKDVLILENIPYLIEGGKVEHHYSDKIVISFIGGVRYVEILKKLIVSTADYKNIEVRIYGEGHESEILHKFLENNTYTHVQVTGRYEYAEVGKFYNESDYIWAVYPSDNFNVKYAISNKFHESLFFGKPGIYAEHTCLGEYVKKEHIGLTVDYTNDNSMKELLDKLVAEKSEKNSLIASINKYKEHNAVTWNDSMNRFYDVLVRLVGDK